MVEGRTLKFSLSAASICLYLSLLAPTVTIQLDHTLTPPALYLLLESTQKHSPRMLQTFPNEIHELILSHLDKSSTSNYSLTCQRTTHVAQRHLFKTVKLKFYTHLGKGQTLPERFLSFLTSSPHICGLVKSLLVRTTGWTP